MAKKKLKRPFSKAHLAALRAAHKKRRGKKRGKYKTDAFSPDGLKIGETLRIRMPTDYVSDNDKHLRQECVKIANSSYLHNDDTVSFLKFVDAMFNYIKSGTLPVSEKPATPIPSETPGEFK